MIIFAKKITPKSTIYITYSNKFVNLKVIVSGIVQQQKCLVNIFLAKKNHFFHT